MENKVKKSFGQKIKELLTAKSVGGVIVRIIILLAIPYAYLLLCGLIFDKWLRMYQMTTFIFISLCVLYVIAIILCILVIKWYNESKKGTKREHKREHKREVKKEVKKEVTEEEKQVSEAQPSEPVIKEEQITMDLAGMAERLKEVEKANTEE